MKKRIAYVGSLLSLGVDGIDGAVWLELVGNGSNVPGNAYLLLLRGPAQCLWIMAD